MKTVVFSSIFKGSRWGQGGGLESRDPCQVKVKCYFRGHYPASSSRIQDTGYKIHRIQDTGYKMHRRQDTGYKIHRIQDTGYSKCLAAWWPLFRGAGGYIHMGVLPSLFSSILYIDGR